MIDEEEEKRVGFREKKMDRFLKVEKRVVKKIGDYDDGPRLKCDAACRMSSWVFIIYIRAYSSLIRESGRRDDGIYYARRRKKNVDSGDNNASSFIRAIYVAK